MCVCVNYMCVYIYIFFFILCVNLAKPLVTIKLQVYKRQWTVRSGKASVFHKSLNHVIAPHRLISRKYVTCIANYHLRKDTVTFQNKNWNFIIVQENNFNLPLPIGYLTMFVSSTHFHNLQQIPNKIQFSNITIRCVQL